MTSEPPRVKDVGLSRSPPFVEVRERSETKREHAAMALIMGLAVGLAAASPAIPALLATVPAFIAGYAVNNWIVFDDCYAVEDGGPE